MAKSKDVDQKALKKNVDAIEGHHDKAEDLVGKMDKTIAQLRKLTDGNDVDKADVQQQIKEFSKQLDALQQLMKKLDTATGDISKFLN